MSYVRKLLIIDSNSGLYRRMYTFFSHSHKFHYRQCLIRNPTEISQIPSKYSNKYEFKVVLELFSAKM